MKDELGMYDPTALIKASRNRFIWVAGNYRLGAYGWLAGTTMERESSPNVGLYGELIPIGWLNFLAKYYRPASGVGVDSELYPFGRG
jgi:carboxylesterase type B